MSDLSPSPSTKPAAARAQRARWRPAGRRSRWTSSTPSSPWPNAALSEAAEALGSPGVGEHRRHRLEKRLGLPLFQRVGRNVRLTDVGRALRPSPPGSSMTSPWWTSCGQLPQCRGRRGRHRRRPCGRCSPGSGWLAPSSASTRSSACTSAGSIPGDDHDAPGRRGGHHLRRLHDRRPGIEAMTMERTEDGAGRRSRPSARRQSPPADGPERYRTWSTSAALRPTTWWPPTCSASTAESRGRRAGGGALVPASKPA